jgi:heme A synthase
MPEDRDAENARFLYAENAKVATQFWEWRHKVLTLYFTAITAVAIMTAWMYQRNELRRWIVLPLILAAAFHILSHNITNQYISARQPSKN